MKSDEGLEGGGFRDVILRLLQERNKRESGGFADLFYHHQKLFENWAAVKAENLRLQVERGGDNRRDSLSSGNDEREKQALERKVLALQEEVTELHRKRGENASAVLTLTAQVAQRDKDLAESESKLAAAVAKCADMEERYKRLLSKCQELEATNDLLRDEHQALHLAYTTLDERYTAIMKENAEVLQRYIEIKGQHADLMNQENENFVRSKQEQVRRELEEAAREFRAVVDETGDEALPSDVDISGFSSLAVGGDYCLVPKEPKFNFDAHEGEVNAVRWSPNGRNFATGGMDRKVKMWENTASGPELKGILVGANASIQSVDYDAGATHILAGSSDNATRVWSVDDLRLRHTLTGHSAKVMAARFLGDTSKVASGSYDRTLKIWDLRSRACVSTKFAGSSCNDLTCVDGSSVISGHLDKRIRFWDIRADSPTEEVFLPGKVTSVDLSRDKNFLLASVRDDSLIVLDLRMNSVIAHYTAEGFKVSTDYDRACFSPNGHLVACGSGDGSIFVWNVMENKLDTVLKDHTAPVVAVHWHPRGIHILSVDKSKKTIIWGP